MGFSCLQVGDSDDNWTEVTFGPAEDPREAAEIFCESFVLNGKAPYSVLVRDDEDCHTTEWIVEPVIAYRAKQREN